MKCVCGMSNESLNVRVVCFGHVTAIPYYDWLKSVTTLLGDNTLVITILVSWPP